MKDENLNQSPSLRSQAEQRLESGWDVTHDFDGKDPLVLIHEMQVHKIELEMQNEELRCAQQQIEEARQRYQDLYEFAPVGYLTLDEKGKILELNLTAANLLGLERSSLVKRPLAQFISSESSREFELFHRRMVSGKALESCEVILADGLAARKWLLVEGIAEENSDGRLRKCRVVLNDITARKSAEKDLQEKSGRLQLFIEHAPAALAMFDRDMRYLSVSRRWLSDYGLEERDLLGVSHYEIFPEISVEWRTSHRRGMDGEVLRSEGDRFERVDGSVQWVRWEIWPWINASGEIGGIVIFSEDITDIKQAQEVLRRYELLVQQSRDIILFIRRDDGRILEANEAAVNAYGYGHEELLGLTVNDLRAPESLAMTSEQLAEADIHGILFETVHRRRDGSTFPVEVSSQGATINGIRTLISIIRDITERKRTDDTLCQQEERLRLALTAAKMATWDWHVPSGEVVWNEMHYRMMGYEPGEVTPSYQAWADKVHPDDITSVASRIQQCMTEGSVYTAEFRTIWPDGTIRWLEARGEFEYDTNNQPLRNYGVMLDFTERKQIEEQIRRHIEELQNSNEDLERFNTASVGRELRMIELKKEVNELCRQFGQPPRYTLDIDEELA